jgi:hypothetical protein
MRITRSTGTFALWAMLVGLVVSGSACVVDEGAPAAAVCTPDLYVNWQVTEVLNGVPDRPITCDYAGATTVVGQVGGISASVPCPAGVSRGAPLYFPLPRTDNYYVSVQLLDASGNVLSQLGGDPSGPSIYVDCSGSTQTPIISLSIN